MMVYVEYVIICAISVLVACGIQALGGSGSFGEVTAMIVAGVALLRALETKHGK